MLHADRQGAQLQEVDQLFRRLAPESADRIAFYSNGVDTAYFSPDGEFAQAAANPYAPGERAIVFCGAMDYWPNIDAVEWFAREVLPAVLARTRAARFVIVEEARSVSAAESEEDTNEGARQAMEEMVEQVELADRVGFDKVWLPEHHFLGIFARSSTPLKRGLMVANGVGVDAERVLGVTLLLGRAGHREHDPVERADLAAGLEPVQCATGRRARLALRLRFPFRTALHA